MGSRVVEISNPAELLIENRQLVVKQEEAYAGSVALEDMMMLILDSYGITLTNELLSACAEHNIAVVVCSEKHLPVALSIPVEGHTLHSKVLREQMEASEPKLKNVWRQVVQAKLEAHAAALDRAHPGNRGAMLAAKKLRAMKSAVESGDATNREGYAADIYFSAMFGDEFERDRDAANVNAALNYGYAILRALIARAIVGTGMHPSIGIHHRNQYNAYALADDLMEPLRPLVDLHVLDAATRHDPADFGTLKPPVKRDLVQFLAFTVRYARSERSLPSACELYLASCKKAICGGTRKVDIPALV